MSRIGRRPIEIPKGVTVNVADGNISVKGPKGELSRAIVDGITVDVGEEELELQRADDSKQQRANHGLMRALISNMVHGVSKGFERRLEVYGIGYKADARGNKLVLNLGFSHPIDYPFPDGISIAVETGSPAQIVVSGIDKERVGQTAAEIRGFRPPDSYKGKGVRYQGEYVRLKAGKTAQ